MRYVSAKNLLVTHFSGARGIITFDLRRGRYLDYYDHHYYPMVDFDIGRDAFNGLAVRNMLLVIIILGICWYDLS